MKKLIIAAVVALTAITGSAMADGASARANHVLEVFSRMLDSGAVKSVDGLYDRFNNTPMLTWLSEGLDVTYLSPEDDGIISREEFHDLMEGDLASR